VQRKTEVTARELPTFGPLKYAEKGLIWGLMHNTAEAMAALGDLDDGDLSVLAGREVFEVARSLHGHTPDGLPSTLLQRLSTVQAQLVTSIAALPNQPAPPLDCMRALKKLRCERENADLQREIDR